METDRPEQPVERPEGGIEDELPEDRRRHDRHGKRSEQDEAEGASAEPALRGRNREKHRDWEEDGAAEQRVLGGDCQRMTCDRVVPEFAVIRRADPGLRVSDAAPTGEREIPGLHRRVEDEDPEENGRGGEERDNQTALALLYP